MKIIKLVKLDYNLIVFINGIENVYKRNELQNFIFVLRACSQDMPSFLKFVFSVERRKNNFTEIDKTLKLLDGTTIDLLDDEALWLKESGDVVKMIQEELS